MEARIARIETHLEHLIVDVADLRGAVVRLDAKVDGGDHRLDGKIDDVYHRLDTKIDDVYRRLDTKIDDVYRRLDAKIDDVYRRLDAKIDRHLLVLGGMIVSLGVGMAGLMAKGFHWF
jgi:tetrahydromethanopterin S-methyltransferase subunit G